MLEQYAIVGGCATVYTRKGICFEVGLHEMDFGSPTSDMKHVIFAKLGINKKLPFVSIPQFFTVKTTKHEYIIPEGKGQAIKALTQCFPEKKQGIKRYFSATARTAYPVRKLPQDLSFFEFLLFPVTSLPLFLKTLFSQKTTGEVFDSLFINPRIKHVLNANIVYYHDDPTTLSWFFHAVAQSSYYTSAVFIKGGSQVLSNTLAKCITDAGGEVRVRADVVKIVLNGNKATGVEWKDVKGATHVEYAKNIIANCAPENIYTTGMVPAHFEEPKIVGLAPAVSLYTVYIVFKQAFSTLYNTTAYSIYSFRGSIAKATFFHKRTIYDSTS